MIVNKKEPSMAPYARKEAYEYEGKSYEADIQTGDVVTIKNAGELVTGQFGEQYEFMIGTRNGDRMANFNQTSINLLIDELGQDTAHWRGKEVHVHTKKGVWGGKRSVAAYFTPAGYMIDEWGDVVKDEPDVPRDAIATPKTPTQQAVESIRDKEVGEMPF